MTYEAWLAEVDATIAEYSGGLTSADLPDWEYREAYDNGDGPHESAISALENAGWE